MSLGFAVEYNSLIQQTTILTDQPTNRAQTQAQPFHQPLNNFVNLFLTPQQLANLHISNFELRLRAFTVLLQLPKISFRALAFCLQLDVCSFDFSTFKR